eukprot:2911812-Prymnesium_polylepis.1
MGRQRSPGRQLLPGCQPGLKRPRARAKRRCDSTGVAVQVYFSWVEGNNSAPSSIFCCSLPALTISPLVTVRVTRESTR